MTKPRAEDGTARTTQPTNRSKSKMMQKQSFGFGIIGCGMISKWHADSILSIEGAYLVGAADAAPQRAANFASQYGCTPFASADDLLACAEIDIVCICTPSGLHAEYAKKVAEAGKHFVVEKPLAITREQLSEVITACEANGTRGCVISQLRFSPAVQKVKKALDEGLLGTILFADLTMKYYRSPDYYASTPWHGSRAMDGGGALMNQGIHGIDLIQYLVGPIRTVSGVCKTMVHEIEVEDTASLTVEFENGAVGTVTGSSAAYPGFPRQIELNGTTGSITLTEDRITHWSVGGETPAELSEEGNGTTAQTYRDPKKMSFELHKQQLADMIDALRTDRKPLVDIYDGKRAVDVILSAYEASQTHQTVFL